MSRKTKREQRKERDIQQTRYEIEDHINGPQGGFLSDDVTELGNYVRFCSKFYKEAAEATEVATTTLGFSYISNYIISLETMNKYKDRHFDPNIHRDLKEFNFFVTLLTAEAAKKGFESVLTYIRFLKLTFSEKDGVYQIVSKDEQKHIKQWVHMKPNFMMKWDIRIDMATPESKHVWEVPEN